MESFNQNQIEQEQNLESFEIITVEPIKVRKDEFFPRAEHEPHTEFGFHDFLNLLDEVIDYKGGEIETSKLKNAASGYVIRAEKGEALIQTPQEIAGQIASLTRNRQDLWDNFEAVTFYFEKFEKDADLQDIPDTAQLQEVGIFRQGDQWMGTYGNAKGGPYGKLPAGCLIVSGAREI